MCWSANRLSKLGYRVRIRPFFTRICVLALKSMLKLFYVRTVLPFVFFVLSPRRNTLSFRCWSANAMLNHRASACSTEYPTHVEFDWCGWLLYFFSYCMSDRWLKPVRWFCLSRTRCVFRFLSFLKEYRNRAFGGRFGILNSFCVQNLSFWGWFATISVLANLWAPISWIWVLVVGYAHRARFAQKY